jgi:citrate lyase beta subunit
LSGQLFGMSGAGDQVDWDALASVLFVPGSRPDRFAKALASGAGLVCIDLEDAVPPDGKAGAREAAVAAIAPGLAIRVNAVTTREGLADLLALAAAPRLPPIFLPKVEHEEQLAIVAGVLGGGAELVALIETPRGLRHAHRIAAHPRVAAVMFGGGDMAAELGVALAWAPLLHARSAFVAAAAEAGRPAIDVPWIALDDAPGLADEAARARDLGFSAKAAIHPAQVDAIEAAFRPAPDAVAEARAAEAAFAEAGGGAARFKGKMLEAPVMRAYRRILARAGEGDA